MLRFLSALCLCLHLGCSWRTSGDSKLVQTVGRHPAFEARQGERDRMVVEQLRARDIHDEQVIEAMATVPRHVLVPKAHRDFAYRDHPLPIGEDQTISQPYIVAFMSQAADVQAGERVLEVGTGSGYQAAVLAELGAEVFSIEIVESLGLRAAKDLAELGYTEINLRIGDGYQGWPGAGPFQAIVVTAAPEKIPQPLLDQLAVGGRLVIPVGGAEQALKVVTRTEDGYRSRSVFAVRFVPMTGEAQKR